MQTEGDRSGANRSATREISSSDRRTRPAPGFDIRLGSKDPQDAFGLILKRIQKLVSGMKMLGVI